MVYVPAEESLVDSVKIDRASVNLNVDPCQIIGHLICLWHWALKQAPDGDLSHFTNHEIAKAARWADQGSVENFVKALIDCGPGNKEGFLENEKKGLTIHDWNKHTGRIIKVRENDAARKREERKAIEKKVSLVKQSKRPMYVQGTSDVKQSKEKQNKVSKVKQNNSAHSDTATINQKDLQKAWEDEMYQCTAHLQHLNYLPPMPTEEDLKAITLHVKKVTEEALTKNNPEAWFKKVCFSRMIENLEIFKPLKRD